MGLKTSFLEVKIRDVVFPNPVLTASGTFGYGKEFERFFKVNSLGGIVTKTITLKPRLGNPPQRVVETPSGMLNAIGLQNVGAEKFIEEKLPYLKDLKIPIIVSVMGYSLDEFRDVVRALEGNPGISGYEMNLSCPNVKYGSQGSGSGPKMFAHDANMIEEVVKIVRAETNKLLIAKLGPDVSDIGAMAQAAERGGADAISLINTLRAMVIDIQSKKPVLKNVTGGLSGPCIRPIAIRMVNEAFNAAKVPILGMGGINNADDALEFMIAGASLVQVGTINFVKPHSCPTIIQGMKQYCKKQKIKSITELIGSVQIEK